jgi:hypothetical protein
MAFPKSRRKSSPPWPPLHFSHNRRKTERGCLPLDSAPSTMTNWKNRVLYTTQQPRKAPLSKIWLCKFWRGAGGEDLPRVKSTDYKICSNQAYLLTIRARRIARDADVRPLVESRHLPNFNRLWNNHRRRFEDSEIRGFEGKHPPSLPRILESPNLPIF